MDTLPVAALHLTQNYRLFMLVRFLSAFIGGQLPNFAAMSVVNSWVTDWATEEQKVRVNSCSGANTRGVLVKWSSRRVSLEASQHLYSLRASSEKMPRTTPALGPPPGLGPKVHHRGPLRRHRALARAGRAGFVRGRAAALHALGNSVHEVRGP